MMTVTMESATLVPRSMKLLSSAIALIKVGSGPSEQYCSIHKEILCQKVPFFDKMLNGAFQEAKGLSATLPTDEPEVFELFAGWIYTDKIGFFPDSSETYSWETLISLFAFAEKYQIVRLADHTMDLLVETLLHTNLIFTISLIESAYLVTHEKSKLRLFCARSYAYSLIEFDETAKTDVSWDTQSMYPRGPHAQDIIMDAHRLLRGLRKFKSPIGMKKPKSKDSDCLIASPHTCPACDYHQHSKEEICPYINSSNKRKRED